MPLAGCRACADRTLTISSAGKTFSFTGWKIGWACGPAALVAAIRAAKQFLTYAERHAVPVRGGRAGWTPGRRSSTGWRVAPLQRRDLFCDGLEELGRPMFRPAGTYFVTTDVAATRASRTALAFCRASAGPLWRRRGAELGLLPPPGRGCDRSSVWPSASGRRCSPMPVPEGASARVSDRPGPVPDLLGRSVHHRRFGGNRPLVCLLTGPADERWMQGSATELGLSETAYVWRLAGGPAERDSQRAVAALVHADDRGRPVRPCHAGHAHALRQAGRAGDGDALVSSDPERPAA